MNRFFMVALVAFLQLTGGSDSANAADGWQTGSTVTPPNVNYYLVKQDGGTFTDGDVVLRNSAPDTGTYTHFNYFIQPSYSPITFGGTTNGPSVYTVTSLAVDDLAPSQYVHLTADVDTLNITGYLSVKSKGYGNTGSGSWGGASFAAKNYNIGGSVSAYYTSLDFGSSSLYPGDTAITIGENLEIQGDSLVNIRLSNSYSNVITIGGNLVMTGDNGSSNTNTLDIFAGGNANFSVSGDAVISNSAWAFSHRPGVPFKGSITVSGKVEAENSLIDLGMSYDQFSAQFGSLDLTNTSFSGYSAATTFSFLVDNDVSLTDMSTFSYSSTSAPNGTVGIGGDLTLEGGSTADVIVGDGKMTIGGDLLIEGSSFSVGAASFSVAGKTTLKGNAANDSVFKAASNNNVLTFRDDITIEDSLFDVQSNDVIVKDTNGQNKDMILKGAGAMTFGTSLDAGTIYLEDQSTLLINGFARTDTINISTVDLHVALDNDADVLGKDALFTDVTIDGLSIGSLTLESGRLITNTWHDWGTTDFIQVYTLTVNGDAVIGGGGAGKLGVLTNGERDSKFIFLSDAEVKEQGVLQLASTSTDGYFTDLQSTAHFHKGLTLDGGILLAQNSIGYMTGEAGTAITIGQSQDSKLLLENTADSVSGSVRGGFRSDIPLVFNANSGKLSIEYDVRVNNTKDLQVTLAGLEMQGGHLNVADNIVMNTSNGAVISSDATLTFGGDNRLNATSGSINIADDATIIFDLAYAGGDNASNALLTISGNVSGNIGSQNIHLQNRRLNESEQVYLISGGTGATYTDTGTVTHDDAPQEDYQLVNGTDWLAVKTSGGPGPNTTMYWMNTSGNNLWDYDPDGSRNWSDKPDAIADNTIFTNNDSVVFDSAYAPSAIDRIITVTPAGVAVEDMNLKGDGDWSFSGGTINGETFTKENTSTGQVSIDVAATFTDADVLAGTVLVASGGSLNADTVTLGESGKIVLEGDLTAANVDMTNGGNISLESGSTMTAASDVTVGANGSIDLGANSSLDITGNLKVNNGAAVSVESTASITADTLDLAAGGTLNLVAGDSPTVIVDSFTNQAGSIVNITGVSDSGAANLTLVQSANAVDRQYEIKVNGESVGFNGLDTYLLVDEVLTNTNEVQVTAQLVWNRNETTPDPDGPKAHGTFAIDSGEFTVNSDLANNDSVGGGSGYQGWDGTDLTKTGAGVLVLNGANTYTGGTEIQEGTIRTSALDSLGTGAVSVRDSAVLDVQLDGFDAPADMADLQTLAGQVNLDAGADFNLQFQGTQDVALTDDMRIGTAAAGSSFLLSAPDKTVSIANGKGIYADSANLTLGAGTDFLIQGDASIDAANAILAGNIILPASSNLSVTGDVLLDSTGTITVYANSDSDIGVLDVAGSFTAQAAVENAKAAPGAKLARSANVILGAQLDNYRDQVFITTTDGVTGFSNLTSNFFKLSLVNNGLDVMIAGLQSQREIQENLFGQDGISVNMNAGATASDTNWDAVPAALQDRIDNYIAQMDVADVNLNMANVAFRQLYGEYGAYARTAQRTSGNQFRSYLNNRVDQQRSDVCAQAVADPCGNDAYSYQKNGIAAANRVWAGGFGSWAEQDAHKGISGYKYQSGGVILGYDHAVNSNFILGFSGAYSRGRTKVDDLQTRFDSDIVNLGVYGAWFSGAGLYAKAGIGFGYGWNDYGVNLAYGGKKDGKYKTRSVSANIELGHEISFGKGFNFTPSVGLEVAHYRNGGWTESVRGNAVAAAFAREHETVADIPVGIRLNRMFDLGGGRYIAPEVSAAWVYSAGDRPDGITASYAGAPFGYRQKGVAVSRHRWQVGAGVKARLSERVDLRLDYNVELRKRYHDHNLTASVGIGF